MLVLSRKISESIIVGNNVKITVVDIRGDNVRFGIEAPSEIPVNRSEVWESKERERLEQIPSGLPNLRT